MVKIAAIFEKLEYAVRKGPAVFGMPEYALQMVAVHLET